MREREREREGGGSGLLEKLARNSRRIVVRVTGRRLRYFRRIRAATVVQHPRTPFTDEAGQDKDGKVKRKQKKIIINTGEEALGYACTVERKN